MNKEENNCGMLVVKQATEKNNVKKSDNIKKEDLNIVLKSFNERITNIEIVINELIKKLKLKK